MSKNIFGKIFEMKTHQKIIIPYYQKKWEQQKMELENTLGRLLCSFKNINRF